MKLQGESTLSDDEKRTEAKRHIDLLQDHFEELAPNEQGFIRDLADRFDRFEERTFISNRQLFWLRDIAERM
jgi:hypothetical protein